MKLKTRDLIERAIEEGLRYGMMRSYKYDDTPRHGEDWTEEHFATVQLAIMNALDEIIARWDDEEPWE